MTLLNYKIDCTEKEMTLFTKSCKSLRMTFNELAEASFKKLISLVLEVPKDSHYVRADGLMYIVVGKGKVKKLTKARETDRIPKFKQFDPFTPKFSEASDEEPTTQIAELMLSPSAASIAHELQTVLGVASISDVIRQGIHVNLEFAQLLSDGDKDLLLTSKENADNWQKRLEEQRKRS